MAARRTLRSSKLEVIDLTASDEEPISAPVLGSRAPPSISWRLQPPEASSVSSVRICPRGSKLPHITASAFRLLRQKQTQLVLKPLALSDTFSSGTLSSSASSAPNIQRALSSTLIFAQHQAGTAVCVSASGHVLTCAHCFGETAEEYAASRYKWMLFHTGQAVLVYCDAWDQKRDLALGRVVAVEEDGLLHASSSSTATGPSSQSSPFPIFSFLNISPKAPSQRAPIICVGQPGRDDLESATARKTTYHLVEASEGRLKGLVPGADPQDNSEIGVQMHDAWTYWGHSGAPLTKVADGTLVGLHSSWDDETAMRHGVPWVALREFLQENGVVERS